MKFRRSPSYAAALLALALAARSLAQLTIDVVPTVAPNLLGSPSAADWLTNAFSALYSGSGVAGSPGTPSYFAPAAPVLRASDLLVTSFASWDGRADPGNSFGAAFANERGNRLLFSLVIDGRGQQFSLSQLSFTATSSDPGGSLGFSFAQGSYNYGTSYVGILYGADGKLGGSDDLFTTASDANTRLVDALVGRGSGNAWWPQHTTDDGLTDQQLLDFVASAIELDAPILVTGTYTLDLGGGASFTGSGAITVIPEPATYTILLAGTVLAFAVWRRRRA